MYPLPTPTATVVASPALGAASRRAMDYAVIGGTPMLAVIDTVSAAVTILDLTDPTTPLTLATANNTTGTLTANGNGTGSVAWGPITGNTAVLYAMSSNHGIQAFVVTVNSLASTTVLDFYKPLVKTHADDASLLKLSRWLTAIWGIILILIAIVSRNWGSVFTVGLTIASLVYGTMLGAFLLGVLTKRANQTGVIVGMLASLSTMVAVKFYTNLAWTWYVLLGTLICLIVGYAVSIIAPASVKTEVVPE